MFRALTCPSSGGQIVLSQHLVTSLSVNGCTICRMTADYIMMHGQRNIKSGKFCYHPIILICNTAPKTIIWIHTTVKTLNITFHSSYRTKTNLSRFVFFSQQRTKSFETNIFLSVCNVVCDVHVLLANCATYSNKILIS